ncbi:MAG: Holliday junction resolvase RuvX [Methylococcales bacterium]
MGGPENASRAGGVLLGFDFGTRKIGVAVADFESGIASPLRTLPAVSKSSAWKNISDLIQTWRPCGLVVGVSLQKDGSDYPVTPRILRFCRQLEGRYRLPVYQIDESLTTFEAKRMLFEDVRLNADTLWKVQDQVAAQLILQTWLNENRTRAASARG